MSSGKLQQNRKDLPPKRGEPELHRAARLGDHAAIRALVASGTDVNLAFDIGLDPSGCPTVATPLLVAAGSSDGATEETMRILLELGADPTFEMETRSVARFAVAGLGWGYVPGGDVTRLQLCLELGCDPNELDCRGVPLLAEACLMGDLERIRTLLDAHASPNAPGVDALSVSNDTGLYGFQIPLHNAVESDNAEAVRLLLCSGANVRTQDESLRSALFLARSEAVARMLIDAGLSTEDIDSLGWTPLVYAIHNASLEGVRALIAAGANVNGTHDRGFTVFMSAVSSSERRLDIMQVLIDAGANPHAVSELGWNAFHAAIDVNGSEANTTESVRETFQFLLRHRVNINHKDVYGVTPMQRAKNIGTETESAVLQELGARN